MKTQSEIVLAKLLKYNLGEFVDVKENVHSDFALHHFNKTTRFKKSRYEVEFSFKETDDMLGDNYLNCRGFSLSEYSALTDFSTIINYFL